MIKPDLNLLAQWLDPEIVEELDRKRHAAKECCRNRKLGTLETLWLMLAVSLDTARSSLHEIVRLATGELDIKWSVSVPAFCKARARFSPGGA
jgi:Insertion element 4 transposase N-terminal